MPSAFNVITNDFMHPYNIAHDTTIISECFDSLQLKMKAIFQYSKERYQIQNVKKTLSF